MKNFKLTIELLPKGAWNNDLSKTLPKKDWDTLREFCYKKANHKCQICGLETDELDAHEVWDFDVQNKTQTLKDIIAICTKCHGVKHFRNSVRLGFEKQAKEHFIKVNNASEIEFATHLANEQVLFEERNSIYYWKIVVNLERFGGKDIEYKRLFRKKINSFYNEYELDKLKNDFNLLPRLLDIKINNYNGTITIKCDKVNKIEWFNEKELINTKYNFSRNLINVFSVKELDCDKVYFKLTNNQGSLISKNFLLEEWQ